MPKPIKNDKEEKKLLKLIWETHFWSKQARDQEFMPRFQHAMRMYMDQTIDSDELQIIYERGQTDVSVNYLRFFLRKMQAYMTANQPQWVVFGSIFDRVKSAYLANAYLNHNWRISKGYLQVVDILKNMTVGGLGLASNFIDYKAREGKGDVRWRSLPVQYYYPDWRSQDQLQDDASFQQVAFTVTLESAIRIAPDREKELRMLETVPDNYDTLFQEGALTYGEFPDPEKLHRVRRVAHYQVEEGKIWELRDLLDNKTYRVNENPDLPLPYTVDIRELSVPRLVKYDCFYGMGEEDGIIFDKTMFPFPDFLIKPFINEFTGNPFPAGEAYFLEKLQKYIDKSLRIALQHEQWNSNPGVFLPEGSVDDIAAFEKKVMWPGFVQTYNAEEGNPFFKQGVAGQTGFYKIVEFMIESMRQGVGNMFNPGMAKGNATEDQLLKEYGQEEGDMLFRNFEVALESNAVAALKLGKYHYTEPMLLKFIDRQKHPQVIPVNKTFVNEEGELDGYYLRDIDHDLVIATRSYAPSHKFVQQERIVRAMQFSPPQVLDLLFKELVKTMELDPEILDEVNMRMDLIPQLQQQMQQMVEMLDEMQKKNKQLESQVFTADRKAVRAGYDAELVGFVDKFKTNLRAIEKIYQNQLNSNVKIQKAIAQSREAGKVGQNGTST